MDNLISRLVQFQELIAIREGEESLSYRRLIEDSDKIAASLLENNPNLVGHRFGLMANPGLDYLSALIGIWKAGAIAVPLCLTYPGELIRFHAEDAGMEGILFSTDYKALLEPIAFDLKLDLLEINGMRSQQKAKPGFPPLDGSRDAMILYTSGTTSKPKGVVTTHDMIAFQISTLVSAWAWDKNDQIISFLPLHHIHGIINVVCCALWSGATIHFIPSFDANRVCHIINHEPVNLFMAVPTIYFKMIQHIEAMEPGQKEILLSRFRKFRLMVSGSAALPISVLEKWKEYTGHTLLERYGMTEIGMAISNPMNGRRRPGSIGFPLPGVEVRLVDDQGRIVPESEMGEIQIKGHNVFTTYWQRPEATREAFTRDGWFRTGDMATIEQGYYRILGRSSTDIIKSGGYKISALEIEEVIRSHPEIKDCAVIGLPDEEWGERVAAALVIRGDGRLDDLALRQWIQNKLPSYRIPREYLSVPDLPRNSMGKVIKSEVKKMFDR